MAMVCKLVCGTDEVELYAGAESGSGWRISSWRPASGLPTYGRTATPVTERIDLICDTTSHDEMARLFQALDQMRVWADQYLHDPTWHDPVWLRVQMEHETAGRQAFIRGIALKWTGPQISTHGGPESNRVRVQLEVLRDPWWEGPEQRVDGGVGVTERAGAAIYHNYTLLGGAHDIPYGDLPARVRYLGIWTDTSGANVGRLWIGLRSVKHSTLGNFVYIWELSGATKNAAESGITNDTTTDPNGASPGSGSGSFIKLIPTDLDWDAATNGNIFQKVCHITLSDITADELAQFGDYLWLLRHMLSAGSSTWEVQFRFGAGDMADDHYRVKRTVEVSNTAWDYAEMGRAKIPVRDTHALPLEDLSADSDGTFTIQVWAKRTSGAAHLYLNCFCPIPIDEGWLKSWDFDLSATVNESWVYGEGADGTQQALAVVSSTLAITYISSLSASNFRLPPGDGRMVIVYAGPTSSDITVGIYAATTFYYERWANLRGAED